jgi:CO dehydrogenase maturation factor
MKQLIADEGLDLAGTVPEDEEVYEFDSSGRPTIELSDDNPAQQAAYEIFDRILD